MNCMYHSIENNILTAIEWESHQRFFSSSSSLIKININDVHNFNNFDFFLSLRCPRLKITFGSSKKYDLQVCVSQPAEPFTLSRYPCTR